MRTAAVVIGSIMVGVALAGALPHAAHQPAGAAVATAGPDDWHSPHASGVHT